MRIREIEPDYVNLCFTFQDGKLGIQVILLWSLVMCCPWWLALGFFQDRRQIFRSSISWSPSCCQFMDIFSYCQKQFREWWTPGGCRPSCAVLYLFWPLIWVLVLSNWIYLLKCILNCARWSKSCGTDFQIYHY